MKSIKILSSALLLTFTFFINTSTYANERTTGRGTGPIVYVTSQGLYYDSIVLADPLPPNGNFQELIPSENGLETEFGPGTPGHLGGCLLYTSDSADDNRVV